MQQGPSGRSQVVDYLLKATRKGGPLAASGIHGRLGDLGTIPSEYDLAVSLATGMLDAIVVDTPEAAQKCVSYVRDKGRITCIVLKELGDMSAKMATAPVGIPNVAQRLFDLITPSTSAVRPAFYTALRDTLVVRDLDTAVNVAYEGGRAKWRVITLDGNLIDQSGTMSGGGKAIRSGGGMGPRSGRSSSSEADVTEATVKRLETDLAAAQSRLQECRAALADSSKRLKDSKQKLKSCEIELEKIELAVNLINEQISDISGRMLALERECELSVEERNEISSIESKIHDVSRRIAASSPDQASLQREAKRLQTEIMEIGGPKLKRAQAKVDAASNSIETLSSSLSAAEVAEGTASKQLNKARTAKEKSEKDQDKALERQKALLTEQADMEKEAEIVMVAMEEAKSAAEAHEEVLKNITKEHAVLKEKLNIIGQTEVDLTTSFDEFSKVYSFICQDAYPNEENRFNHMLDY